MAGQSERVKDWIFSGWIGSLPPVIARANQHNHKQLRLDFKTREKRKNKTQFSLSMKDGSKR